MKLRRIILLSAGAVMVSGCTPRTPIQDVPEQATEAIADSTSMYSIVIDQSSEALEHQSGDKSSGAAKDRAEPMRESIGESSASAETSAQPEAESVSQETGTEESPSAESRSDDTVYIGEYLDSDVQEPNLEIAKGENGSYRIQIGIYRLTFLDDGIGQLAEDGMHFTATDSSGNPIRGIITVKGETATVTFTDSTWEYLPNGSTFQYTKSSDVPVLME